MSENACFMHLENGGALFEFPLAVRLWIVRLANLFGKETVSKTFLHGRLTRTGQQVVGGSFSLGECLCRHRHTAADPSGDGFLSPFLSQDCSQLTKCCWWKYYWSPREMRPLSKFCISHLCRMSVESLALLQSLRTVHFQFDFYLTRRNSTMSLVAGNGARWLWL